VNLSLAGKKHDQPAGQISLAMQFLLSIPTHLAILPLVGCAPCSDEVRAEVVSTDKALKATWFVRNCGATTDFSTIVSAHRPDDSYRDRGDFVFVARGERPLRLEWTGPRQLTVECPGCGREDIFRRVTVLGNIDIVQ
jgi:hypothetical protein